MEMWTREQILERIQTNKSLRQANPHLASAVSHSWLEPVVCHEPLAETEGEEKGPNRVQIRITAYRARLLDADGPCVKAVVDCLRYAGAIRDDTVEDVEILTIQRKVKHRKEEMTLVELIPIE